MHVVVQHRITDPDTFFSVDAAAVVAVAPDGVHGRLFYPSQDRSAGICVWQAPSVDAVRDYIDPATAGVCENAYFEVDEQYALGLFEAAAAQA
jgi:hypothetical protein